MENFLLGDFKLQIVVDLKAQVSVLIANWVALCSLLDERASFPLVALEVQNS